jgi:hypothetical protein
MTIATTSNKSQWQGNGSTTVFPFTFEIGNVSEITLSLTSGGSVTDIPPSSFAVSGLGSPNGGTIVYPLSGSPIAQGTTLTLLRTVPLQQLTDLQNQSNYFPDAVEGALDYLMMVCQQIAQQVDYCLQTPQSDPTLNLVFPNAAARAQKLAGFDANGNATTYPITASVGAGNLTAELGSNGRPGFKAGSDFTVGQPSVLTLSQAYGSVSNVFAAWDGSYKERDSYQIVGDQIQFGSWSGDTFVVGTWPNTVTNVDVVGGTTLSLYVPPDGSVGPNQLQSAAVGDGQIAWGRILKRVVGSVAAVAALNVSAYQEAFATDFGLGYGGGGSYTYNASLSQTNANGGTIIASDNGPGCWVLKPGNSISLQTFGAAGNGTTDDTTAVNAALACGGNIDVPAGTYACSASIKWKVNGTWLRGAGRGNTIFKFTSAGTSGLVSNTKGTTQLLYCRASDIQFLDDGGLGYIVDLSDMQFCQLERCFTYGFGGAGSIGVYMGASNNLGTLQCTYNRIEDHYNGNTQYGIYLHDGANANTIVGGRLQSGVASAIGIILAPSGFNLVNGNSIIQIGIEQPSNTLTGIQLNGNTSGTTIVAPRLESLLNGIVINASDVGVTLVNPYYSGCTNNLVDQSNGKAFLNAGASRGAGGPAASFNYNGTTDTTNSATNCTITRAATGQYNISGLPFANAFYKPLVCSSAFQTSVAPVDSSHCNVFCYNAAGGAVDASIFGTFTE